MDSIENKIDTVVSPVGSGGSSSGLLNALRVIYPEIYSVAVNTPVQNMIAASFSIISFIGASGAFFGSYIGTNDSLCDRINSHEIQCTLIEKQEKANINIIKNIHRVFLFDYENIDLLTKQLRFINFIHSMLLSL